MSIEFQHVSKSFGPTEALKDVTAVFGDQKICGLLGRNGAGKSTLLNLASCRISPDQGEILIGGESAWENARAQSALYFMSEPTYYPDSMRVREAFRWTKNFYPTFDAAYAGKLADSFSLDQNSKVKGLSTGYHSIFKLTLALSVNVPYVLLDEPVLGLDANHRELFYKLLLAKYAERPFTAVLSTHLIEEAANLIEDVVILKEGRVIAACPTEELLAGVYTVSGAAGPVEEYLQGKRVLGVDVIGGLRSAYVEGSPQKEAAAGLEFGPVDLQKLFVLMTNS